MKMRLGALTLLAVIAACGIKGAPKPSRKPPPKAEPPAAVTAIPAREPTAGGLEDAGIPDVGAPPGDVDAGTLVDAGTPVLAAPTGTDAGTAMDAGTAR